MPASLYSWYGARELDLLGQRRSVLHGVIELKRFNRLAGLLEEDIGTVQAELRFRRDTGGWLVVELEYESKVRLLCQRCLEPLEYDIKDKVEVALLESESLEIHSTRGGARPSACGHRRAAIGARPSACSREHANRARPASNRRQPVNGSSPASRNAAASQMSGNPINAVGSSLRIARNSAIPSPSALNPPAQSYGCSISR